MRIGLDFDNTVIRYDEVFATAAKERGLLSDDFSGSKQDVRDAIRLLPDGELAWQRLQGHVYGKGIAGASIFPGVEGFLRRARARGDTVLIVSHKTEYGHFDPERVSLRQAALAWMRTRRFFQDDEFGFPAEQVYFESTLAEKLRRIADLRCDIFIDDLEEVLGHQDFPASVKRILFSEAVPRNSVSCTTCRDWLSIEKAVFDGRL